MFGRAAAAAAAAAATIACWPMAPVDVEGWPVILPWTGCWFAWLASDCCCS